MAEPLRGALFLILLPVGLLFLWLSRKGRAHSGLPQGKIVYVDTGGRQRVERPLFSHCYRLVGRPDYLVAQGREIIPVEVKTGRTPAQPYPGHILQLAAYCLLVEEQYHHRPSYGIIVYPRRAFEVEYSDDLRAHLLATLEEMRAALVAGEAHRNHDSPARCRGCGYRRRCDESLIGGPVPDRPPSRKRQRRATGTAPSPRSR